MLLLCVLWYATLDVVDQLWSNTDASQLDWHLVTVGDQAIHQSQLQADSCNADSANLPTVSRWVITDKWKVQLYRTSAIHNLLLGYLLDVSIQQIETFLQTGW